MAVADVILSVNSKLGPGGMASLQAAGQMVAKLGKKVVNTVKDMEKFSMIFSRLEIDISEADAATKGLVDTMALMRNANKFTAAQMEITGKQFKDVAVLATNMAKKMGTDVTSEMNALTDAITRGSTRALKRYGLDLENTEDLQLAQAEGMEKVSAAAKGMTVEIETLSESMYVFGNNVDTTMGLLFHFTDGGDSGGGVLGDLNGALSYFNEQMVISDGALTDYMLHGGGLKDMMNGLNLSLVHGTGLFGDWTKEINAANAAAAKSLALLTELANIKATTAKTKKSTAEMEAEWRADKERIDKLLSDDYKPDVTGTPDPTTDDDKKPTGSGRGVNITRGEAGPWRVHGQQQISDLIGTEQSGELPPEIASLDIMADVEGIEELTEAQDTMYKSRMMLLWESWEVEQEIRLQRQADDEQKQIWWAEAHGYRISAFEELLGIEQHYVNESTEIWESGLQGKLGLSQTFFSAIGTLQAVENKKAFYIGRAAAYSENVVQTLLASMKAYQALAGIPYVGPVLGAAAAAAVGVAGAAIGNKIRTTPYGGGGTPEGITFDSGGASGGMGGDGGYGGPSSGQSGGGGDTTVVEVVLTGGAEGIFSAVVNQNESNRNHGGRTFSEDQDV
ncbi:MAG: hypothetical protein GY832_23695 [Chloroflexi bacterium]|nr:hypothetical protein [Chloroflexota bacterium]